MAIFQRVEATVECDNCKRTVARLSGPNDTIGKLQYVKVICERCDITQAQAAPLAKEDDE